MRRLAVLFAATVGLAAWSAPAAAYVGPGAGLSLLGAAVGLVVAIFVAIGVVVAWPVRRLLKRRKRPAADEDAARPAASPGAE